MSKDQLKKKSDALPEYMSDSKDLVNATKGAVNARTDKANAEKEEKDYKVDMILEADEIRTDMLDKGDFIGVIKVIDDDIPPTRVEFRINNGALDVSEMGTLNRIFGNLRPALFEKVKVVTDITDPQTLYDSLVADGKNPWDYLNLTVKKDMDVVIGSHPGCTTAEAILPKKGLLARLKENATLLNKEAMTYIETYLRQALKTIPILGTKGKS